MSISHHLAVIATRKCFSCLLSSAQNFTHPPHTVTLAPGAIFLKIESLHLWVSWKAHITNKGDWFNTFRDVLLKDTQIDRQLHARTLQYPLAGFNNLNQLEMIKQIYVVFISCR